MALPLHNKKTGATVSSILWVLCMLLLASCKKDLETNPRSDILVPATPKDFQALLDNYTVMNETPELGELSADNYYLTYAYWQTLITPHEKNGYIWAKDLYLGQKNIEDWNKPYAQVLYTNIVLEGIEKNNIKDDLVTYNHLKGSALFARAFAFYNLVQLFSPVYDSATASTDKGIPLRMNADINYTVPRSTVQETYDKIIADLQEAYQLLAPAVPVLNKNRPSKPAVAALLARIYLSIGDYTKAGEYAGNALQLYNALVDYNGLNPFTFVPFAQGNQEIIFQSQMYTTINVLASVGVPECIIDSALYQSYHANDLRQSVYYFPGFTGNINLKGSYNGTIFPFTGLATDELYFIRAEYYAWIGNVTAAMEDLNTVLEKRWVTGTYVPFTALSAGEALAVIREERRKELAFRGLRWTDLRRLNKKGANITLQRKLNGTTYTLEPNSKLYVLPLPPDVITLGGIEQNDR